MKKIVKRLCGILLAIMIAFGGAPLLGTITNGTVETQAASYPTVILLPVYASVGETAYITMSYYPAFNNEELIVNLYDPDGYKVGTASQTFSNKYASSIQYYTVTWNTAGYEAGTYRIEVIKKFYSMYQWNTAPTTSTGLLFLADDISGISGNNQYSGSQTHFTCTQDGSQDGSGSAVCGALSAWGLTAFTDYDIQLMEMYLGEEAKTIVREENPYNPSGAIGTRWLLMRFRIHNKSGSSLEAKDVITSYDFYKYSGSRINACTTASFSEARRDMGVYDVTIGAGETADVWIGMLIPTEQQMPYLLVNGTYLNTNPQYAETPNDLLHSYGSEKTVSKEATCKEEGIKAICCTVCGTAKKGTEETIPKSSHVFAKWTVTKKATCTERGTREAVCDICGEKVTEKTPKAEHDWSQWTVQEKATITKNGKETRSCNVCGETETRTIPATNNLFNDVKDPSAWFYEIVYEIADTVNNKGTALMSGYKDGSGNFGPADPLTRQDFAVILYRLADEPPTNNSNNPFPDANPKGYYYKSILWAKANQVITGYDNGKFGVGDNITREQVATILYRYAKNYIGMNVSEAMGKGNLKKFKDAKAVSSFATDALTWANGAGIITGKDNGTKIDPQGNAARAEIGAMILRFVVYVDSMK